MESFSLSPKASVQLTITAMSRCSITLSDNTQNTVAKEKLGSPVLVGELISWRMLLPDRLVDLPISRWGSKISRYLETMRTEMK